MFFLCNLSLVSAFHKKTLVECSISDILDVIDFFVKSCVQVLIDLDY